MSSIIRGPSMDASYQVHCISSFGQAVSEENIFRNRPTNQKQELPMMAMFVNGLERNYQSL